MSSEQQPIARTRGRRVLMQMTDCLGMLVILIVLILLFSLLNKRFCSISKFTQVANDIPELMVVAVGMTFVLIIAGIDLSVGSVMALSGAILGVAIVGWHWPVWMAVPLCLVMGLGCGLLNGSITVRWAIPSFIVTLGMLEIARGGASLLTHSRTEYIGSPIEFVGCPLPRVGLSPAVFIALLVVLLGQLMLSKTTFGRHMFAVGGNPEAARLSGINLSRVKITVFALAGLLTGLGAWFQVSRLGAADPGAGIGLELSAIAACVIGGTSLMGGRGSVINTFFGVAIIGVLEQGLRSLDVTNVPVAVTSMLNYLGYDQVPKEPLKRVVTGTVIILAVIIDTYRRRLSRRRLAVVEEPSPKKSDA